MEIFKAKLVKAGAKGNDRSLTVTFHEEKQQKDGPAGKRTVEYESYTHPDLLAAFQGLAPHFGLLTESLEVKLKGGTREAKLQDVAERSARLIVTSFSYGPNPAEKPGISISGYKLLANGKTVQMNAPFTRTDDDEDENAYPFLDELQEALEEAEAEIQNYIGGKKAPEAQQALDFGQPVDDGDKSKTTVNVLKPVAGGKTAEGKPNQDTWTPEQYQAEIAKNGQGSKDGARPSFESHIVQTSKFDPIDHNKLAEEAAKPKVPGNPRERPALSKGKAAGPKPAGKKGGKK